MKRLKEAAGEEGSGEEGGYLGGEEGAGADGKRAEDEHVAAVGEGGVPAEDGDDARDGHGGLDEEVLEHVGERMRDGGAADEEDGHGEAAEEADGDEDGGELSHEARGVAVGGEEFEVDDAEEEDAVEDTEGMPAVGEGRVHGRLRSLGWWSG
ncbi:MAG: hypothetical protein PW789_04675 [Edaphobacter sp.]|uniref:hypothetical protein n=1 Tax=Edaphobacter sp. TaxID=1934404 RepID=UPI0023951CEA|nr:hypothetical protein [Edaphobacter sp.]MDE1175881.1 hypothetical protein [Edaphobacter sp.]